jgi:hypothetical protein
MHSSTSKRAGIAEAGFIRAAEFGIDPSGLSQSNIQKQPPRCEDNSTKQQIL